MPPKNREREAVPGKESLLNTLLSDRRSFIDPKHLEAISNDRFSLYKDLDLILSTTEIPERLKTKIPKGNREAEFKRKVGLNFLQAGGKLTEYRYKEVKADEDSLTQAKYPNLDNLARLVTPLEQAKKATEALTAVEDQLLNLFGLDRNQESEELISSIYTKIMEDGRFGYVDEIDPRVKVKSFIPVEESK